MGQEPFLEVIQVQRWISATRICHPQPSTRNVPARWKIALCKLRFGCVRIVTWYNSYRDSSAKTKHAVLPCAETPQRLQTFQHLHATTPRLDSSDLGEMKGAQECRRFSTPVMKELGLNLRDRINCQKSFWRDGSDGIARNTTNHYSPRRLPGVETSCAFWRVWSKRLWLCSAFFIVTEVADRRPLPHVWMCVQHLSLSLSLLVSTHCESAVGTSERDNEDRDAKAEHGKLVCVYVIPDTPDMVCVPWVTARCLGFDTAQSDQRARRTAQIPPSTADTQHHSRHTIQTRAVRFCLAGLSGCVSNEWDERSVVDFFLVPVR